MRPPCWVGLGRDKLSRVAAGRGRDPEPLKEVRRGQRGARAIPRCLGCNVCDSPSAASLGPQDGMGQGSERRVSVGVWRTQEKKKNSIREAESGGRGAGWAEGKDDHHF